MYMQPFLIIQNDANEGAGLLMTLIKQRCLAARVYYGWEADYKKLNINDYCALVVLGGAQGVYEVDKYVYLQDEIALTRKFIDGDKPIIGLCLGAQILATALGGTVSPNQQKEIGWHDIELTEEATQDDLMLMHPKLAKAFHFHGDFFTLPAGCVNLAKSELTESQLFRYRDNVYGFQFHAEIDEELVEIMCRTNADYMQSNGYDADDVIKQSEAELTGYQLRCSFMLNKWLDKAV